MYPPDHLKKKKILILYRYFVLSKYKPVHLVSKIVFLILKVICVHCGEFGKSGALNEENKITHKPTT